MHGEDEKSNTILKEGDDSTKMDLKEMGVVGMNWIHLTQSMP
jgi:hypothetical protein